MGRIISLLLSVGIVSGALAAPQAALGNQALSPPVSGAVLTRYGARYETSAGSFTHRGLDLGAPEGAAVVAAAEGIVTFAGLVPADGGGRSTAVTITTPSGLLVTVSPLLATSVGKGEHVVAGDEVGTLAGAGDASSAQPHVHFSVRVDGTYIDPEPMLGAVEPEPSSEPASQPQPAAVPQLAPAPVPAPAPAPAAVAQPVLTAQPAAVGSPAGSTASVNAPTPVGAAAPEAETAPMSITLRVLERAQLGLRAGVGAISGTDHAVQAAHIAPEMLRDKPTLDAPHLSGVRTVSMGVLLAAAAGLALWSGLDRRAGATARSGTQ
jgi:hypothetical protein